jgi:hypothetical protein
MSHAMLMNSCPFCGKNIFTQREFEFRNAVYKILVKNGLDDDQMINGIIGDIISTFASNDAGGGEEEEPAPRRRVSKKTAAARAAAKRRQRVADEYEEEEEYEDEDDGLTPEERNAPSRVLAPSAPRPPAKKRGNKNGDAVADAMRAFEDNERPITAQRSDEFGDDDEDGSDVFFMENPKADEVARRRAVAKQSRQGVAGRKSNSRPSFTR